MSDLIFRRTRAIRSGERARFVGLFQGCTRLWTAGCWLARRLYQLKASTTMDLGISCFLISVQCVVVVLFTLKAVPISTQYFLTSVLVQLTRTPSSVVTG